MNTRYQLVNGMWRESPPGESKADDQAPTHQFVGPPASWREIQACLEGELAMKPDDDFDPSSEPTRPCSYCGELTRRTWWTNDVWCWQHQCGWAGEVEICESCRAWYPVGGTMIVS